MPGEIKPTFLNLRFAIDGKDSDLAINLLSNKDIKEDAITRVFDNGDNLLHSCAKKELPSLIEHLDPSDERLMQKNKVGKIPLQIALGKCDDNNNNNTISLLDFTNFNKNLQLAKLLLPKHNHNRSLLLLRALRDNDTNLALFLLEQNIPMNTSKLIGSLELAIVHGNTELIDKFSEKLKPIAKLAKPKKGANATTEVTFPTVETDQRLIHACFFYAKDEVSRFKNDYNVAYDKSKLSSVTSLLKKHGLLTNDPSNQKWLEHWHNRYWDNFSPLNNKRALPPNLSIGCLIHHITHEHLNFETYDEFTTVATRAGRYDLVELFIELGVKVNQQENNRSFLDTAIAYKQNECVELLLEHGADPNIPVIINNITYFPLVRAFQSSNLLAARLLLKHGADPDVSLHSGYLIEAMFSDMGLDSSFSFFGNFDSPVFAELVNASNRTFDHLDFSQKDAPSFGSTLTREGRDIAINNFKAILKKHSRPKQVEIPSLMASAPSFSKSKRSENVSMHDIYKQVLSPYKLFHQNWIDKYFTSNEKSEPTKIQLLEGEQPPLLFKAYPALFNLFLTCKQPQQQFVDNNLDIVADIFWTISALLIKEPNYDGFRVKKLHSIFIKSVCDKRMNPQDEITKENPVTQIKEEFKHYYHKLSVSKGHSQTCKQFIDQIESETDLAKIGVSVATHFATFTERTKVNGTTGKLFAKGLALLNGKKTEPKWDEERSSWDENGTYYQLVKKWNNKIKELTSSNNNNNNPRM